MLEATYKQTVTVREPKPGTRAADGRAEWQPVLLDESALRIRCRFVEKKAKTTDKAQAEIDADATMVWRQRGAFRLTTEHLVVFEGRGFTVLSVESEPTLFGSAVYKRARLALTEEKFPVDNPDGE